MRPFTLLGVPIDSVGRDGGTELSPAAFRDLGLLAALGGGPDRGDLPVSIRGDERDPDSGLIAEAGVLGTTRVVHDAVRDEIEVGGRPFLAGGCCTLLVGALAGARDALGSVSLAYFDGHLDLYDGRTSPTGEAADMPISVALGRDPRAWTDVADGASIEPARTALLGYRDLEESLQLGAPGPDELGVIHRDADALRDPTDAMTQATDVCEELERRGGNIWLHLDVDVLDELVFPATDYLAPDGLTWEALLAAMRPFGRSTHLIGASVACYNPQKDPHDACGRELVKGLAATFDD